MKAHVVDTSYHIFYSPKNIPSSSSFSSSVKWETHCSPPVKKFDSWLFKTNKQKKLCKLAADSDWKKTLQHWKVTLIRCQEVIRGQL